MRTALVVVVEPSGDLVKRGSDVRHGADAQMAALERLQKAAIMRLISGVATGVKQGTKLLMGME
jgi:hypothetical protein